MGTVYRARHRKSGRIVAVKILPRNLARNKMSRARFGREARAALQLDHPNIVRGYEIGVHGGLYYLVMEYVGGTDLHRLVSARGRLTEREVLSAGAQVARALEHAAANGIIHRDVKPANIILARDGTVKLTDLGLAKSVEADAAKLTNADVAIGTPHYIAPEQAMAGREVDIRADIFSLGATMYHLVTGVVPFDGGPPAAVMARRLTDMLADPRETTPRLSPGFVRILERMLARAPEDRYSSPSKVRIDIERCLAGKKPFATHLVPGASAVFNRDSVPAVRDRCNVRESAAEGIGTALPLLIGLLSGVALSLLTLVVALWV